MKQVAGMDESRQPTPTRHLYACSSCGYWIWANESPEGWHCNGGGWAEDLDAIWLDAYPNGREWWMHP